MTATLQQLIAEFVLHPDSAEEIPLEVIPAMLIQLAATQSLLAAKLIETAGSRNVANTAESDQLLDVEQAAEKLGVTPDWLYRRSKRLPFAVRLGRALKFSQNGLDRWIRSKAGKC